MLETERRSLIERVGLVQADNGDGWQRQGQAGEGGEGGDRLVEEDYTE